MSLVGPRPEMVAIVDRYEPWQHHRHAVRPGLTGPWQVSMRGSAPLHACTALDIEYVEQVSPLLDAKVLLKTPVAALRSNRGF